MIPKIKKLLFSRKKKNPVPVITFDKEVDDIKLRHSFDLEEEHLLFSMVKNFLLDTADESQIPEPIVQEDGGLFYSEGIELGVRYAVILSNGSMGTHDETYDIIKKVLELYKDNGATIHHYVALMVFLAEFRLKLSDEEKYGLDNSKGLTRLAANRYIEKLANVHSDNKDEDSDEWTISEIVKLPVEWQWDLLDVALSDAELAEAVSPWAW